jgi:hypothetical protein
MHAQMKPRAVAPRARQLALPLPPLTNRPDLEPARRAIVVELVAQMLLEAAVLAGGGTSNDEQ